MNSTPKGRQMAGWPQQDSYRGPKNPAVAPVASPTAFVCGVPAVCGLGDPIGEQRWTLCCTLIKCTTFRGINHPSTPKGRQMAGWPQQDSYRGPKNPAVAPVASPTAFVCGVPAVCGLGDQIGEQRWTLYCTLIKCTTFRG